MSGGQASRLSGMCCWPPCMSRSAIAPNVRSGDRGRCRHQRRHVVRTAKTLGYANLRELRQALADGHDETDLSARLHATIGDSPSTQDVLATAVDRHLEALHT